VPCHLSLFSVFFGPEESLIYGGEYDCRRVRRWSVTSSSTTEIPVWPAGGHTSFRDIGIVNKKQSR
jgi:hypothetical protein